MYTSLFYDFILGEDNLRVYEGGELIYSSDKENLIPWLEYIRLFYPYVPQSIVFDKILGNAAALLAVKAGCRNIYSPLGSRPAISTLEKYHIKYQIINIVPFILQDGDSEMCHLEKLSLGQHPDEFFESVRHRLISEEHQGR